MNTDFIMEIEEVDLTTNRGIFIQGKIENGNVYLGAPFEIIGNCIIIKTIIAAIEKVEKKNQKVTTTFSTSAQSGDTVRLLLSNSRKDNINIGQIVSTPKVFRPHSTFKAKISLSEKEEAVRSFIYDIFHGNIEFRKNFNTNAIIYCLDRESDVLTQDNFEVLIEMEKTLAIKPNLKFTIYKENRKMGIGTITEIIE